MPQLEHKKNEKIPHEKMRQPRNDCPLCAKGVLYPHIGIHRQLAAAKGEQFDHKD